MTQKIIIIGAGIIGASAAYQLQKAGASVTVIDAGGASATRASFGWINASFFLDHAHFEMRAASIAAYRDLMQEIALPVNWCGCLCFETTGADFDTQRDDLRALGYAVDEIDAAAFVKLEPHVGRVPERSLVFQQEAAAESGDLAQTLLRAACDLGARVINGVSVERLESAGGVVTGVHTNAGFMQADQVISAVGTGTQRLLATVNIPLPLLTRPAVMLKTQPLPPMLAHVLVSEIGELRQLPDGSLLMPAAIAHQQDSADKIANAIDVEADAALARLQAFLPNVDLRWEQATLAYRPVPQDERPVVGAAMGGLYVACAHSGITLGALLGELIAQEVLNGPSNETARYLAHYRPGRFAN